MRRFSHHFWSVGIVLLFFAFTGLCAKSGQAGPPRKVKSPFKIGEKVEVDFGGDVYKAEVIGFEGMSGWVRVRFTIHGNEITPMLPPERIRKILKKTDDRSAKKTNESAIAKESNELRIWTDITGTHTTNARFVELKDGKVHLKKSDGKIWTIPLEKLSEEDQKLAKQLAAKKAVDNPFADDEESDMESDHGAGKHRSAQEDDESDDDVVPKGNWIKARRICIDQNAKGTITPDVAVGEKSKSKGPIALDTPKVETFGNPFFEKPGPMFLDRQRQRLVVVHLSGQSFNRNSPRLECCNLRSGKSMGSIALDTTATPVDLSPDGSSVVCLSAERFGYADKSPRAVEVWRLEKQGKLVNRWGASDPDFQMPSMLSEVNHAMFVSPSQVLTVSSFIGTAALWNVETAEAVYSIHILRGCVPALSANRKQLAVMAEAGVAVLDAVSGDTIAILPGEPEMNAIFAFHPDGTKLVALSGDQLRVWDLKSKTLINEIWLPRLLHNGNLQWIGDCHMLVGNSFLIDLTKKIVLWEYCSPSPMAVMPDGMVCYAVKNVPKSTKNHGIINQSYLCFISLPHSEASLFAIGLSDDQLLAVKPGSQVSLDVRISNVKPEELKMITDSLTKRLQINDIKVADGMPIVLEAVVEPGKTEAKTYKDFFHGFGDPSQMAGSGGPKTETVNVTTYIYRLTFKENGHVLWERQSCSANAPSIVRRKKGQSLESAITERQGSPTWFFLNTMLPRCVVRYGENCAFGKSMLTPNGPVTTPAAN